MIDNNPSSKNNFRLLKRDQLIIILFFALARLAVADSWVSTNGPYGHSIRAGCIDSAGVFFAATLDSGIYRSTNGGASWSLDTNGLNGYETFYAMAAGKRGEVYAGTYDGMVFRSSEHGAHWIATSSWGHVRILALSINSKGDVYAGTEVTDVTEEGQIFFSSNGGISWKTLSKYYDGWAVYSICFDEFDRIFMGTISGLYLSENSDSSWVHVNPDDFNDALSRVLITKAGDLLYYRYGITLHSTNAGQTWQDASMQGDTISVFALGPDETIFAGTTSGKVLRSSDNGTTWIELDAVHTTGSIMSIDLSQTGFGSITTSNDGIFTTTNLGATWQHVGLPITVSHISVTTSGKIFSARDDGVISNLNEYGDYWPQFKIGSDVICDRDSAIFIAHGCITKYHSILDSGTTKCFTYSSGCQPVTQDLTSTLSKLSSQTPAYIYAGGLANSDYPVFDGRGRFSGVVNISTGLIIRSTDFGYSWQGIYGGYCQTTNRIFAGAGSVVIFEVNDQCQSMISTDFGATWNSLSDSCYLSIGATSTNVIYKVGHNGTIKRSADAGAHWDVVLDLTAKHSSATTLLVGPNDLIIAGTSTQGVYYSYDGTTWTFAGSDLPASPVGAMAMDSSGHLYVALNSGVYKSENALTSVRDDHPITPNTFSVFDIFPNPAIASPTLAFVLSEQASISAELFDVLGRSLVLCTNEVHPIGTVSLQIPIDKLPSGICFCRVHAGSRIVEKSFVIAR